MLERLFGGKIGDEQLQLLALQESLTRHDLETRNGHGPEIQARRASIRHWIKRGNAHGNVLNPNHEILDLAFALNRLRVELKWFGKFQREALRSTKHQLPCHKVSLSQQLRQMSFKSPISAAYTVIKLNFQPCTTRQRLLRSATHDLWIHAV